MAQVLKTALCVTQVITKRLIILTHVGMDVDVFGEYVTLATLTHTPLGLTLTLLRSRRHSLYLHIIKQRHFLRMMLCTRPAVCIVKKYSTVTRLAVWKLTAFWLCTRQAVIHQMATLDATKLLLLTNPTKLTLIITLTITDTVTVIFFYAHFVDTHKKVISH